MTAVASFLIVLLLSLIVVRVASVALTLTGLSRQIARFQARSAFTGTGFTTSESETITGHPVRRRIVMALMLLRNAGLIGAVSSLVLSFTGQPTTSEALWRLGVILVGLALLWLLAQSQRIDRAMSVVIRWALNRWTDLEARDYARLLDLSGAYAVRELHLKQDSWLVGKTVRGTKLHDEGLLVLGITRSDGTYIGAPRPDTELAAGDALVIYGRTEAIRQLNQRQAGQAGDAAHQRAVAHQQSVERAEKAEDPADEGGTSNRASQ